MGIKANTRGTTREQCIVCYTVHYTSYICPERRDGLWALLKDKEVAGPIKEYARAALGLGDSQENVGVVFVTGGPVPAIPCATCGAMPVGVFGDGSPRYAASCSHPPIMGGI